MYFGFLAFASFRIALKVFQIMVESINYTRSKETPWRGCDKEKYIVAYSNGEKKSFMSTRSEISPVDKGHRDFGVLIRMF